MHSRKPHRASIRARRLAAAAHSFVTDIDIPLTSTALDLNAAAAHPEADGSSTSNPGQGVFRPACKWQQLRRVNIVNACAQRSFVCHDQLHRHALHLGVIAHAFFVFRCGAHQNRCAKNSPADAN